MTAPVPNPYILYPFAGSSAGGVDTLPIPNTGTDSGSVNYQNGFPPNYEYPSTNPSSLPVPRPSMNQLFLDITYALQQLQTQGYPLWVAPATGSPPVGGPVGYPIFATVAHNYMSGGVQIYTCISVGGGGLNSNEPGSDNTWLLISGNAQGVPTGTVILYTGINPPSGYLSLTPNATANRTTYANLMAVLTQVYSCTTNATTSISIPSGTANLYVGMALEGTGIPTSTLIASIVDATHITISAAATNSTTENITFFNTFNGDGSTTFTLPNGPNTIPMGAFGSPIAGDGGIGQGSGSGGGVPGQKGGRTAVTLGIPNMPEHNHPNSTVQIGTGGGGGSNPSGHDVSFVNKIQIAVAPQGGGAGFNIIPQAQLYNFCIKY